MILDSGRGFRFFRFERMEIGGCSIQTARRTSNRTLAYVQGHQPGFECFFYCWLFLPIVDSIDRSSSVVDFVDSVLCLPLILFIVYRLSAVIDFVCPSLSVVDSVLRLSSISFRDLPNAAKGSPIGSNVSEPGEMRTTVSVTDGN